MTDHLPPIAAPTGTSAPNGAQLRELFSHISARFPGGAQFAVVHRGEPVVDLAIGGIGTATPVQVYSVSKALVAVAAAHASDAGLLDLDAPVSRYWSAFDRAPTRAITAQQLLDHSAGIPAIDRILTLEDLLGGELDRAVEEQDPYWEPGTQHGYGPFTFGALLGGVFRHGVGVTVQEYVREHVVAPVGADFWFGAPNDVLPLLATLDFEPPVLSEATIGSFAAGTAIADGSFAPILAGPPAFFTDPRVQQADWPSMSGVTTARGLADIFTAVIGQGEHPPTLSAAALARLTAESSSGPDRTGNREDRFGAGVELPHPFLPLLGPGSFGHQGAGGSVIAANPVTGTVVAYTTTRSEATLGASSAALILLAGVRSALEIGQLR